MQPEKWGNLFEAEVITAHHTHISTIELLNVSRSIITLCSFHITIVCMLPINQVNVKSVGGNGLKSKNISNITYQTIQVSFFISEKAV